MRNEYRTESDTDRTACDDVRTRHLVSWRLDIGEVDEMRSKRIYVAGPYTVGTVTTNVRAAILAADELALAGYTPFVPHLSLLWGLICPHDYEFWIEYDMKWLEICDCLVRLPGESPGGDLEAVRAKLLYIPVYYSVEEALEAGAYTHEEDKHDT